jgi:hypothetical protein
LWVIESFTGRLHFVSSTPQHFGAMNLAYDRDLQFNSVDYWWSREKFKPGAV